MAGSFVSKAVSASPPTCAVAMSDRYRVESELGGSSSGVTALAEFLVGA